MTRLLSNRRFLRDAYESALDRASFSAPKPERYAADKQWRGEIECIALRS